MKVRERYLEFPIASRLEAAVIDSTYYQSTSRVFLLAETAWEGGQEADPILTGHDEVGPWLVSYRWSIAITLVTPQLANLGSSEADRRQAGGRPPRWPRDAVRDNAHVNKTESYVFAAQLGRAIHHTAFPSPPPPAHCPPIVRAARL
jgi:hypothetical protein